MVPGMQFARDQILNPLHKKVSRRRKEMNHPLSHCSESSGLNNSAVISAPGQAKCSVLDRTWTQNNPCGTTCLGKMFLTPSFRWVAFLVELKSNFKT